jgi:biopolymer transport protein ExbD
MPKIHVAKKSTSIDMTAMCDVSFLLLTFFILTAKFKPADPVMIDIPASRSQTKIEKALVVSVDKDGKAYLALSSQEVRRATLDNMIERMGENYPQLKSLTESQKKVFSFIEVFGTPIEDMPRVLSMSGPEYKEYQEKQLQGIPKDSVNNQLGEWIMAARYADPKMKIAVKGDKFTNIKAVQRVMSVFKEKDINRFNLITSLSGGPEEEEKAPE